MSEDAGVEILTVDRATWPPERRLSSVLIGGPPGQQVVCFGMICEDCHEIHAWIRMNVGQAKAIAQMLDNAIHEAETGQKTQ